MSFFVGRKETVRDQWVSIEQGFTALEKIGTISGRSRGGARVPSRLFWVKKEMTKGRKAGRASKVKSGPHLNSKSGSATDHVPPTKCSGTTFGVIRLI